MKARKGEVRIIIGAAVLAADDVIQFAADVNVSASRIRQYSQQSCARRATRVRTPAGMMSGTGEAFAGARLREAHQVFEFREMIQFAPLLRGKSARNGRRPR